MECRILLIEDDLALAGSFQRVLQSEGWQVAIASRGDDGVARARRESFDLVITDVRLPGLGGLEVLEKIRETHPRLPVIVMTAHSTTQTAIQATKLGACDYLVKPFEIEELLDLVAATVQQSRCSSVALGGEPAGATQPLLGKSRAMQAVYKDIGRVASTPVTVLIRGESGTGKELVARAIYQHSPRAGRSFVAVNCAAIPENLLESELFGHERGAFTGAHARRIGRFEQAQGGTLFLDEIGDLPLGTQAKLLRVLQEKSISRLGSGELIPIDVRLLAATHRDLEAALQEKEFREDLYYRLNVVTIRLPALRERREDIPELAQFFIARYGAELGAPDASITTEALALLQQQPWLGNVRQLENIMRQALLLSRPFAISDATVRQALAGNARPAHTGAQTHAAYVSDLLARAARGEVTDAYARMITDLEPELFAQAIKLSGGNLAQAARWLGLGRARLRQRLQELGLRTPEPPQPE